MPVAFMVILDAEWKKRERELYPDLSLCLTKDSQLIRLFNSQEHHKGENERILR